MHTLTETLVNMITFFIFNDTYGPLRHNIQSDSFSCVSFSKSLYVLLWYTKAEYTINATSCFFPDQRHIIRISNSYFQTKTYQQHEFVIPVAVLHSATQTIRSMRLVGSQRFSLYVKLQLSPQQNIRSMLPYACLHNSRSIIKSHFQRQGCTTPGPLVFHDTEYTTNATLFFSASWKMQPLIISTINVTLCLSVHE